MTPSIPGQTLSKAGLCLLLITNLLVWSASWNTSSLHGGQFEQLGDRSPPFLVGTGDNSSGDDTCTCTGTDSTIPSTRLVASAIAAACGVAVAARVRISSYPVLPQAPPALT